MTMEPLERYVCPETREALSVTNEGLSRRDGRLYPFLGRSQPRIPDFTINDPDFESVKRALEAYDSEESVERYRNYVNWIQETFAEEAAGFRHRLADELQVGTGDRVLVTGCGTGEEIRPLQNLVGARGEIYASDIAPGMVLAASNGNTVLFGDRENLFFSVCNAARLPFADDFFDAALHFGGINQFGDAASTIREMERVVRSGGRVVFGDEGVAPWLKHTEYGRIAITNNHLWDNGPPVHLIPRNAVDVSLSWVLGNCFYIVSFEVSASGPQMNLDVPHAGVRGGTMRTRYYGRLEGVTEQSKQFVLEDARRKRISVHEWLERMIDEQRNKSG